SRAEPAHHPRSGTRRPRRHLRTGPPTGACQVRRQVRSGDARRGQFGVVADAAARGAADRNRGRFGLDVADAIGGRAVGGGGAASLLPARSIARAPLSPAPNLLGCAAPTTDRCSLSRSCFALPLASVGRGVSPPRLVARARVSPAASTFTALSRRRQRQQ